MSCYANQMAASYGAEADSLLVNGDPIIFSAGTSYILANIITIKKANTKITSIDLSQKNLTAIEYVEFTVRNLETEEIDGKMFWNGMYKGSQHVVYVQLVLPIHPNVMLYLPENFSNFSL